MTCMLQLLSYDILYEPTLLESIESPDWTQVACGGDNTIFLSRSGQIYRLGCGSLVPRVMAVPPKVGRSGSSYTPPRCLPLIELILLCALEVSI